MTQTSKLPLLLTEILSIQAMEARMINLTKLRNIQ